MPFRYILANLLADTDATGVLFLDGSGETVDVACAEGSPYDMRVLGAYLGIYLKQLETVLEGGPVGTPRLVHIERERQHVFATTLPDDYYLVLVQSRPGIAARTRTSLRRAAAELQATLFA